MLRQLSEPEREEAARVEALFETLSGRLLAFIRSRIRDDATAEDVLQETFLTITRRIGDVRDEAKLTS